MRRVQIVCTQRIGSATLQSSETRCPPAVRKIIAVERNHYRCSARSLSRNSFDSFPILWRETMRLHANARTCPHMSVTDLRRVIDDSQSPITVAIEFRVSSRTVHKWLRRHRKDGVDGLMDKSSRPHRIPRKLLQPG